MGTLRTLMSVPYSKLHTRCPSLPYSLSLSLSRACLPLSFELCAYLVPSSLPVRFDVLFWHIALFAPIFSPFCKLLNTMWRTCGTGEERGGLLNWNFYYSRQLALVGSLFRHRCIWQALNDGINSYPSNACAYCRVSAKSLWLHCEFQLSDVETGNVLRTCVISSEIHFGVRIMRGYK